MSSSSQRGSAHLLFKHISYFHAMMQPKIDKGPGTRLVGTSWSVCWSFVCPYFLPTWRRGSSVAASMDLDIAERWHESGFISTTRVLPNFFMNFPKLCNHCATLSHTNQRTSVPLKAQCEHSPSNKEPEDSVRFKECSLRFRLRPDFVSYKFKAQALWESVLWHGCHNWPQPACSLVSDSRFCEMGALLIARC